MTGSLYYWRIKEKMLNGLNNHILGQMGSDFREKTTNLRSHPNQS